MKLAVVLLLGSFSWQVFAQNYDPMTTEQIDRFCHDAFYASTYSAPRMNVVERPFERQQVEQ